MTDTTIVQEGHAIPNVFTRDELDWLPWLQPLDESELTDRHWAGLVDKARSKSPYFMLLARDPDTLKARTLTDKDIFYNTKTGLPRAERELAAAATSRYNGCIYCCSVHARFATQFSKRADDVDRLLESGVANPEIDPRWDAIISASAALTSTPSAFTEEHIATLRSAGLDDTEISDIIHGASFFNWANRLMLSLGEPAIPSG